MMRMRMRVVMVMSLMVTVTRAQVDIDPSAPGAERRVAAAQGGNGTFFQPFINGINTFFNPSQFRNPLDQFRNQQQSQQPQPQRGQQQQFTSFPAQPQQQQQTQQFGSSQQTFNFQDFRNNPTFQQDFQLTRFPQGQVTSEQQFSFVPRQPQQQPPAQPQFPDFSPSARPAVGAGPDNVPG